MNYAPDGNLCINCTRSNRLCNDLNFDMMKVISSDNDWKYVKCDSYKKNKKYNYSERKILEYENYIINTEGHIFNFRDKLRRRLKAQKLNHGYYGITLENTNGRKMFLVHRLVAFAFCDGYTEGLVVNHKNGNKLDNRANNLEWVTLSENSVNARETGLWKIQRGNEYKHAKLTESEVISIRKLSQSGVSNKELAVMFNMERSSISRIVNYKSWMHVK